MSEDLESKVIRFDLKDPEQVDNLERFLKKLISMYTPEEYRLEMHDGFGKIINMSANDRIHHLQIELANACMSFHMREAIKLDLERRAALE